MKIANTCRDLRDSLIVAFSMYSKIPMPRTDWTDHSMKYSMCFFPWIGWVIGILEALWLYLSFLAGFSALFRAAVFTVLPLLLTGGIHLDGYLDTSDAMSSGREREKRLEILKDSHTGAFAIINAGIWFILFFGSAAQLAARLSGTGEAPSFRVLLLLPVLFGTSRSFSAISVVSFPHANPSGTAAAFGDRAVKKTVLAVMAVYLAVMAVLCGLCQPAAGLCMMGSALLIFGLYYRLSMKYFGGMTGDLAGCFVSVCELVMLILLAVMP